jgi:hypothetical protein
LVLVARKTREFRRNPGACWIGTIAEEEEQEEEQQQHRRPRKRGGRRTRRKEGFLRERLEHNRELTEEVLRTHNKTTTAL